MLSTDVSDAPEFNGDEIIAGTSVYVIQAKEITPTTAVFQVPRFPDAFGGYTRHVRAENTGKSISVCGIPKHYPPDGEFRRKS